MDNIKKALDDVIDLFPDEIKSGTIHEHYSSYLLILKTVMSYPDSDKKTKILDVGAGSGIITMALQNMGHSVTAVDTWAEYGENFENQSGINDDIINRLETNGVKTIPCDIEKDSLPFDDNCFDMVLCLDVIEHLHNSPKKVLAETRRVLRPGGKLILTTPNLATLKNRLYMLFGRSVYTDMDYWYNNEPFFGHVREYTVGEVKSILKQQQFNIDLCKLSNSHQIYILKDFQFTLYTFAMMFYLMVTAVIPKFRYTMIVVSLKN